MRLMITGEYWGGSVIIRPEDLQREAVTTARDIGEGATAAYLLADVVEIETESANADEVRTLQAAALFAPVDADIEAAIAAAEARLEIE